MRKCHVDFAGVNIYCFVFFFFQAEDGIRDGHVTGVQTCALPISMMQSCASVAKLRSGGPILHGLSRRNREWVRRFGASLPMRMTASWFGSLDPPNTRLWRDRSALERGLPSDRHLADPALLHSMVPPCSELSRPSPVGGRRRGDQP